MLKPALPLSHSESQSQPPSPSWSSLSSSLSPSLSLPTAYSREINLKVAVLCIELILYVVLVPLFVARRRHPVIKFRTWSLDLYVVTLLVLYKSVDTSLAFWQASDKRHLRTALTMDNLLSFLIFPVYHAIFIRHYILLQIETIRHKMVVKPVAPESRRHDRRKRRLAWYRMFDSHAAAWAMYSVHAILLAALCLWYGSSMNVDDELMGRPTPFSGIRATILLIEPASATIFLFWNLSSKAIDDHYGIKNQFFILIGLTNAIVFTATCATVFPESKATVMANDWASAVLPLMIILVHLLWPLHRSMSWKVASRSQSSDSGSGKSRQQQQRQQRQQQSIDVPSPSPSASSLDRDLSQDHVVVDYMSEKPAYEDDSDDQSDATSMSASSMVSSMGTDITGMVYTGQCGSAAAAGIRGKRIGRMEYLDYILSQPALRFAFAHFVQRDLCSNELLFVMAIQRFKAAAAKSERERAGEADNKVQAMANEIAFDFCRPGAPNDVGLPRLVAETMWLRVMHFAGRPAREGLVLFDGSEEAAVGTVMDMLRRFEGSAVHAHALVAAATAGVSADRLHGR
ncbi:hypothetical protein BC831DRAFT_23900 [Entophlyctis helioformis]|nr:hypothetical protein BC831DRAFT_23900 [Entophlyctis helioformis]